MVSEIYYSNCRIEFSRDKIYMYLINILFHIFVSHLLCIVCVFEIESPFFQPQRYILDDIFFTDEESLEV